MRGRRWATAVAAMTLALGGLVGASTPAAADPPGGTLRGVYYDFQFCHSYGNQGLSNGQWQWFYCEYRASGPSGSGFYFLWTFTY
ncbi:hypothetical protein E1193_14075 [Micromonospora sp. KC606]|uniref:hypothetical protein n=1 Tax=Micromonospora sp. KC606 TaxID=2530379 RepID=UPI0010497D67|nr:hypothetical protein [Micromonospora sp. KC606]TDC81700.1 hypothetical protein E1193_14075 [Micromonospora sp. KC606]